MQTEQVLRQFALLAGLEEDTAAAWAPLCEAAAAGLKGRLKPGTDPDTPGIALAAAGIACCQYLLCGQGKGQCRFVKHIGQRTLRENANQEASWESC